jgi:hypothetical protein
MEVKYKFGEIGFIEDTPKNIIGVWTKNSPDFNKIKEFLNYLSSKRIINLNIDLDSFVAYNCDSFNVSAENGPGGKITTLKPIMPRSIVHDGEITWRVICSLRKTPEQFDIEMIAGKIVDNSPISSSSKENKGCLLSSVAIFLTLITILTLLFHI